MHSRRLYNISFRILQDSGEAEEVMQDTILKYVTKPFKPLSKEQISAWLARTCIRASIDALRRRKREALFLEEYAREAVEAGESEIPTGCPAGKVLEAIRQLPDPQRLVVTLVLIEGLDYGEIAGYTGIRETTLRSAFSRGRQKLMTLLQNGEPVGHLRAARRAR